MGSGKFANGKFPIVTQGEGGGEGGWCKGLGTAEIDRCIMHDHYGDNMLLTKETVHFTMLQFTASVIVTNLLNFSPCTPRGLVSGYFGPLNLHCIFEITVKRERIKTIVYLIQ